MVLSSSGVSSTMNSSFLLQLTCFTGSSLLPQSMTEEEGWQEFNESMHSRFGFKGSQGFPTTGITSKNFTDLEEFRDSLDKNCQWMVQSWMDNLEPYILG